MGIDRGDVEGLAVPPGYRHVAEVTAGRFVFVAGQVPLDERGDLVGPGDHVAQTEQCLRNVAACLRSAGATPDDVVRTTVYVVAPEQEHLGLVWRTILDSDVGAIVRTPATLVGVARLGYTGQLVEIDVTAALPPG
jgi:enamine deaminase RidA (YjgF/YER057c/UK114 family)